MAKAFNTKAMNKYCVGLVAGAFILTVTVFPSTKWKSQLLSAYWGQSSLSYSEQGISFYQSNLFPLGFCTISWLNNESIYFPY